MQFIHANLSKVYEVLMRTHEIALNTLESQTEEWVCSQTGSCVLLYAVWQCQRQKRSASTRTQCHTSHVNSLIAGRTSAQGSRTRSKASRPVGPCRGTQAIDHSHEVVTNGVGYWSAARVLSAGDPLIRGAGHLMLPSQRSAWIWQGTGSLVPCSPQTQGPLTGTSQRSDANTNCDVATQDCQGLSLSPAESAIHSQHSVLQAQAQGPKLAASRNLQPGHIHQLLSANLCHFHWQTNQQVQGSDRSDVTEGLSV